MKIFKVTLCLLFLTANVVNANPFRRFTKDSAAVLNRVGKYSTLFGSAGTAAFSGVVSVVSAADTIEKSVVAYVHSIKDAQYKKEIKKSALITVGYSATFLVSSVIALRIGRKI